MPTRMIRASTGKPPRTSFRLSPTTPMPIMKAATRASAPMWTLRTEEMVNTSASPIRAMISGLMPAAHRGRAPCAGHGKQRTSLIYSNQVVRPAGGSREVEVEGPGVHAVEVLKSNEVALGHGTGEAGAVEQVERGGSRIGGDH